jgi:hypothetical protein
MEGVSAKEEMVNRNGGISEGKESEHTELNSTSEEEKSKDSGKIKTRKGKEREVDGPAVGLYS